MSGMPERIWLHPNKRFILTGAEQHDNSTIPTTEYIRADLVAGIEQVITDQGAVIERLREAVEMAWGYFDQCCLDQRNMVPNSAMMRDTLAAYLREREGKEEAI